MFKYFFQETNSKICQKSITFCHSPAITCDNWSIANTKIISFAKPGYFKNPFTIISSDKTFTFISLVEAFENYLLEFVINSAFTILPFAW